MLSYKKHEAKHASGSCWSPTERNHRFLDSLALSMHLVVFSTIYRSRIRAGILIPPLKIVRIGAPL